MDDRKPRVQTDLATTLSILITANHILDHYGLVDGFGHISVRDPECADRFYMTGNTPPAFVSGPNDLAHYNLEDGSPVTHGDSRCDASPYSERFCHSEIMRRYPYVNAVVHSHSREVTAVGVSGVSMKPMYHMAAFLGSYAPNFDIGSCYKKDEAQNKLVNSARLGEKLADYFTVSPLFGKQKKTNAAPDHTVVLQRGHGFTTWGSSIEEAVYRAYYTQENARIQLDAATLSASGNPNSSASTYSLGRQEIWDCAAMNQASVKKAWAYWSRIVETHAMYKNDLLNVSDRVKETNYWSQTEKGQPVDAPPSY